MAQSDGTFKAGNLVGEILNLRTADQQQIEWSVQCVGLTNGSGWEMNRQAPLSDGPKDPPKRDQTLTTRAVATWIPTLAETKGLDHDIGGKIIAFRAGLSLSI